MHALFNPCSQNWFLTPASQTGTLSLPRPRRKASGFPLACERALFETCLDQPLHELRTTRTRADHCCLVWFMVPQSAMAVDPHDDDGAELAALAGERAEVLRDAIASLSEREQTILVLLYVKHMQGAEVGRMLGISESRVSQILSSIRRTLKERIDTYDSVVPPLRRAA